MYTRCTGDLAGFYNESDISIILSLLNSENGALIPLTWREMSSILFDDRIEFASLSAYARGRSVVNRDHRRLLLIKGDDRNRRSISLDDPVSAAVTILTARLPDGQFRASDEFIERLADLLDYEKR